MIANQKLRQALLLLLSLILGVAIGIVGSFYISNKARLSSAVLTKIRGASLYAEGKIDLALGTLYQSLALNSDDYSAYKLIGKIYVEQGKLELALEAYEQALAKAENGNYETVISYDKGIREKVIAKDIKEIQAEITAIKEHQQVENPN